MTYSAKIIADSLAPSGKRLTTMEVCFPRFILAEFNTHRQFSRNSASSRAIPTEKIIARVMENPFVPEEFVENKKGMQGGAILEKSMHLDCVETWLNARNNAVYEARNLLARNVHKQYVNRLLEPFMWHTAIVSATEWSNFFAQRCHPDAQPEIQKIAYMMRELYEANVPDVLNVRAWHLPYIQDDEWEMNIGDKVRLSVARCARVSYLSQDGLREHEADYALFARLEQGSHWSPFEHVAQASEEDVQSGNFTGWVQYRKRFANECR